MQLQQDFQKKWNMKVLSSAMTKIEIPLWEYKDLGLWNYHGHFQKPRMSNQKKKQMLQKKIMYYRQNSVKSLEYLYKEYFIPAQNFFKNKSITVHK